MKFHSLFFAGALMALPSVVFAGDICVVNGSEHTYLFAAEAHGAIRETAMLAPSETLCVSGAKTGVVSVFEVPNELEGCSRLVTAGQVEGLIKYVDFDRCFWTSNSS